MTGELSKELVMDSKDLKDQQPMTPLSPGLLTSMSPAMEPYSDLPITPPGSEADLSDESVLDGAVHVLSTEADALSCLAQLYKNDRIARNGFAKAVDQITQTAWNGGKLVVSGVGKSGKIAMKLVATMNSLGIMAVYLHPIEALHGDMGIIRNVDTLLLITFSGKTPELAAFLSHIPLSLPVIKLTSHAIPASSPLVSNRPDSILLPAPIPESEEVSFSVSAPTTSTTVALALGDALALSVARKMHTVEGRETRDVFRAYHPGGAIGMAAPK